MFNKVVTVILLVALNVQVNGHGRLMKPPSRSSLWRISKFAKENPPANYNDNALICGGVTQTEGGGTGCGVCGDPIKQAVPRDNEIGGKYYRGIITAQYRAGDVIDIEVEITNAHKGYMEWRLCTTPSSGETQSCFNRYVLQRSDGRGSKVTANHPGWYRTQLRLPAGVTSEHGVIQWIYHTAHNLGPCSDGSIDRGCGPQLDFRGCSDVSISK